MSHRWDCPTRWEAEREGERAQEWGRSRSSNPYEDYWHRDEGCPEAADAWRDGYRRSEIREEERHEEEAARRRAEARRAYELEEEAFYTDAMYQAQLDADQRAYYESLESTPSADAVDPVGGDRTE